jgi:hypothetical protein
VFEVEVEAARNLARTRYTGTVTAAHMRAGVEEVARLLPPLRAGFTVLADLSGLEAMDLDCAPHLAKIMELCKAHGVGRVIRVIPDPAKDIGLNILSLIHYRGKVQLVTCSTLAEAEQELK